MAKVVGVQVPPPAPLLPGEFLRCNGPALNASTEMRNPVAYFALGALAIAKG